VGELLSFRVVLGGVCLPDKVVSLPPEYPKGGPADSPSKRGRGAEASPEPSTGLNGMTPLRKAHLPPCSGWSGTPQFPFTGTHNGFRGNGNACDASSKAEAFLYPSMGTDPGIEPAGVGLTHPASLTEIVNAWTIHALLAAEYLVKLYRRLRDDRQAAMALLAGGPCEERARRCGLASRISGERPGFLVDPSKETWYEALSWELLIEAHAGLLAFHSVVGQDSGSARGLRGSRTATQKALRHAVQGYRTAFPEEMAEPGIRRTIGRTVTRFMETFIEDFQVEVESERASLRQDLHDAILLFLTEEVAPLPPLSRELEHA